MAVKAESVPAAPGGGSRFALTKTLAGWSVSSVAAAVAHAYGSLLDARKRDAAKFVPASVSVSLRYPVKRGGGWELADRGTICVQPKFENRRPSKLWKQIKGGAFLDSFFLGEDAWLHGSDGEVWAALLDVCEAYNPPGRERRLLADQVAIAVAARAGVDVSFTDLPYPPS
jgi:hypothetical protein